MIPKKIYIRNKSAERLGEVSDLVSVDAECCAPHRVNHCTHARTIPVLEEETEYTDLSQVWHDAKTEEPDLNEHVLFEFVPNAERNPPLYYRAANVSDRTKKARSGWKPISPSEIIRRWAYIKDLLPKGGEQ